MNPFPLTARQTISFEEGWILKEGLFLGLLTFTWTGRRIFSRNSRRTWTFGWIFACTLRDGILLIEGLFKVEGISLWPPKGSELTEGVSLGCPEGLAVAERLLLSEGISLGFTEGLSHWKNCGSISLSNLVQFVDAGPSFSFILTEKNVFSNGSIISDFLMSWQVPPGNNNSSVNLVFFLS